MSDSPGLRQRQRERTWRDLHEAAVALAREHGIEGATIEAIAERAGVSRRTFFNYYPSKEDAILGLNAPQVATSAVEAFRAQAPESLFPAVIQLVSSVWRSTVVVDIGRPARRAIVHEFPPVRGRMGEHAGAVEDQVAEVIVEGNARYDLGLSDDPRTLRSLVLLASAVLKVTDGPDGTATTPRSQETIDDTIDLFTRLLHGER
ncbi:TetR/AcrR family transcriptional regulator [Demequina flava]|uniref:TetR/AcrR family transcriptional regulator n=1 Tax=Demequina flava TaxID=1095025 RepID=UPI0007826E17|nr:TetR/AcrR family transcriptional regulator [Demequina flava]